MRARRGENLTTRRRVYEILEASAGSGDATSRAVDFGLMTLILLNVVAVMGETVPEIAGAHRELLRRFEVGSVLVFSVEYGLRLWSCVEGPGEPLRWRFALRPLLLIDLLAVLPCYVHLLGFPVGEARIFRSLRILRLGKLARYSSGLRTLGRVSWRRRRELTASLAAMVVVTVVAASLVYPLEHAAQPESFPSIPASCWWAVSSLTTIGYGDVVPVTAAGQLVASLLALLSLGVFTLPAAILGSGLVEELEIQRRRAAGGEAEEGWTCPHCSRAP